VTKVKDKQTEHHRISNHSPNFLPEHGSNFPASC